MAEAPSNVLLLHADDFRVANHAGEAGCLEVPSTDLAS